MNKNELRERLIQEGLGHLAEVIAAGEGQEILQIKTNICIVLTDEHGVEKDRREIRNLVVTAGKQKLLLFTSAFYLNQFAYTAIGTGTTAANAADTALQTEVARSSVITPSNPDASTLQFAATFAAGTGTGAITEAGNLSAASVGTLLNRTVFAAVNKGASDALTITTQFTIS